MRTKLLMVACLWLSQPACRLHEPALGAHTPRPVLARDHCELGSSGRVSCSFAGGPLTPLSLPLAVRAAAGRYTGGAYLLGVDGELVRLDPRGRVTGVFETGLLQLTTTRDYVCGVEQGGAVLCARDLHHDFTCPGVSMSAWTALNLGKDPALFTEDDGATLCARDADQQRTCVSARARCDTLCLSYPACSSPRCIDPCTEIAAPEPGSRQSAISFHHP